MDIRPINFGVFIEHLWREAVGFEDFLPFFCFFLLQSLKLLVVLSFKGVVDMLVVLKNSRIDFLAVVGVKVSEPAFHSAVLLPEAPGVEFWVLLVDVWVGRGDSRSGEGYTVLLMPLGGKKLAYLRSSWKDRFCYCSNLIPSSRKRSCLVCAARELRGPK